MKLLLVLVLLGAAAVGIIYLVFLAPDSEPADTEAVPVIEPVAESSDESFVEEYVDESAADETVIDETIVDETAYETIEYETGIDAIQTGPSEVDLRRIEGEGWNQTLQINIFGENERSIALVRIVSITDDMSIIEPMIDDYLEKTLVLLFDPSSGPMPGQRFVLVTYETAWPEDTPISEFGDAPHVGISLRDITDIRIGNIWDGQLAPITLSASLTRLDRPPAGYIVSHNSLMQIPDWAPLDRVAFMISHASAGIDDNLRSTVVDIDNNIIATFYWD